MSKETALAALQSLSDEEADLLNSDAELLSLFQKKHGIGGAESQPAQPGLLDRVVAADKKYILDPLAKVGSFISDNSQVSGQEFSPQNLLGSAPGLLSQAAGAVGSQAAEELGRRGVNPYLSAAVGTVAAMGPDIAMSAAAPRLPQGGFERALASGEKKVAKAVVPRILRSTAGIPETLTKTLIDDIDIPTRLSGTTEAVAARMKSVQEIVQQAKSSIGALFWKVQKRDTGLDSPMDDLIDDITTPSYEAVQGERTVPGSAGEPADTVVGGGIPATQGQSITDVVGTRIANQPKRTLQDIALDYQAAKRGDLLKEVQRGTGAAKDLPVKEQLAKLTKLKRELQSQANYNKSPVTLQPIDTVLDASIKKMSSEIDALRTKVSPEIGKRLSFMDDAWKEVRDIYGTIQKDLADPGRARDTFMRIAKGDSTWLTGGRFDNKSNAIRRVEKITGENIIEPAMKEITALAFAESYGKGIGYVTAPIAAMGAGVQQMMTGNIASGLATMGAGGAVLAAGSPRVARSIITGAGRAAKAANRSAATVASQTPLLPLGFGQNRKKKQ